MSPYDHDPGYVGAMLAMVFITFAWNVDWRHYIRYWRSWGSSATRARRVGFRIFFALAFAGAARSVFIGLSNASITQAYFTSLLSTFAPVLIIFVVFDLIARKRLGPPAD